LNHNRWNLLPPVPDNLASISTLPPLVVQLLYNRGLTDPGQLYSFITSDESLLGDPYQLPDMQPAVARIYQALLSGESIAVYGDFDADGVTATALLVQGLSALGGKVIPYIPHRVKEDHGLTHSALEHLAGQGISLVITVDCGITDLAEVEKARKIGLDIVITDHHAPLPEIPAAVAVVDPKLPYSTYPFSELAGVGVALKLFQALLQSIGKEEQLSTVMDLVALGTIADMSPLLGENRYLVKEGLRLINASPRLGIREMMTQTGINSGDVDAEKVSWVLAPRLNASGRLAHAVTSYDLLMTSSPEEASQLARELEERNGERQKLTAKTLAHAREQVVAQGIQPLLVACDEDYPIGVAGLVAGRLTEEFYHPTIVVRKGDKVSTGSCRSIPAFNIVAALNQCSHLLTRFGGHSQAAGFTLPTKNLPQLQEQLNHLAATQLEGVDLRPHIDIDTLIKLADLGGDTFQATQMLAPFGRGNPVPTFLSLGVEVLDCRTMGNDGGHLRLKLRQDGTVWDGVGFKLGNQLNEISSHLDVVYTMDADRWNGRERLRLNILDFASTR